MPPASPGAASRACVTVVVVVVAASASHSTSDTHHCHHLCHTTSAILTYTHTHSSHRDLATTPLLARCCTPGGGADGAVQHTTTCLAAGGHAGGQRGYSRVAGTHTTAPATVPWDPLACAARQLRSRHPSRVTASHHDNHTSTQQQEEGEARGERSPEVVAGRRGFPRAVPPRNTWEDTLPYQYAVLPTATRCAAAAHGRISHSPRVPLLLHCRGLQAAAAGVRRVGCRWCVVALTVTHEHTHSYKVETRNLVKHAQRGGEGGETVCDCPFC